MVVASLLYEINVGDTQQAATEIGEKWEFRIDTERSQERRNQLAATGCSKLRERVLKIEHSTRCFNHDSNTLWVSIILN